MVDNDILILIKEAPVDSVVAAGTRAMKDHPNLRNRTVQIENRGEGRVVVGTDGEVDRCTSGRIDWVVAYDGSV